MDDSLVIGLWLLVILCLLFLDIWLLLLKYLSTLVPDSLSRVPEGQSLRLGSLNSKACPLPMVSYPRLIFRFSSFIILTRQPEWTITTKTGVYAHSAGAVIRRVG
jgi:hypothetical protein